MIRKYITTNQFLHESLKFLFNYNKNFINDKVRFKNIYYLNYPQLERKGGFQNKSEDIGSLPPQKSFTHFLPPRKVP